MLTIFMLMHPKNLAFNLLNFYFKIYQIIIKKKDVVYFTPN